MGTMANLIREGKNRHIKLGKASVVTLERAHKVHPIFAQQIAFQGEVLAGNLALVQQVGELATIKAVFLQQVAVGEGYCVKSMTEPTVKKGAA